MSSKWVFVQVHFRHGLGEDKEVVDKSSGILAELGELTSNVKEESASLEECVQQIDTYQKVHSQITS